MSETIPSTSIVRWIVWLCLLGPGYLVQAADSENLLSIIQLPKELQLRDQTYRDINDDGLTDLILSVGHRETPFKRSLRIYCQQRSRPCFALEPDEIVPLTPDVIAYALAETDPSVGQEVLLFTAQACFGYRLQGQRDQRLFKMVEGEFLWQLPDKNHVFSWQDAILDIDGNGTDDIFWPQAGGFCMVLQHDHHFEMTPWMSMPLVQQEDTRKPGEIRLEVDFKELGQTFGLAARPGPLVQASQSCRVPLFTDFNGDGRLDVIAQAPENLSLRLQSNAAALFSETAVTIPLPLEEGDERRLSSTSHRSVVDLNRDGRCDFVLVSKNRRAKNLSTQVLIYMNKPEAHVRQALFGPEGMPDQFMKLSGLPGDVQIVDINGDGYPDLSFPVLRFDLLDKVKTMTSRSIEFQLLVFLNRKGRFQRIPDLMQDMSLSLEDNMESEGQLGRFVVDYNGDGLLDALQRVSDDRLGLRLLRQTKKGLSLAKPLAWDMAVESEAKVIPVGLEQDPVLLVVQSDQIMQVRFK